MTYDPSRILGGLDAAIADVTKKKPAVSKARKEAGGDNYSPERDGRDGADHDDRRHDDHHDEHNDAPQVPADAPPPVPAEHEKRLFEAKRSIALAKGGVAQLKALEAGARSMAMPIRHGAIARADVIDGLCEQASNSGMYDDDSGVGWTVVLETINRGLREGLDPNRKQDDPPPAAPLPPLQWVDMSTWDSEPRPEREWAILNRVPNRQSGLFSGEGGTGKSISEMMKDVAHVAGKDWFGSLPMPGPAWYLGAEDDEKEIHIRFHDIAKHYGVTFKELIAGGLKVLCLLGQDATLCHVAGKSGRVETTQLYRQLYEEAGDVKPKNISIDTLSRAFAGSEIDRVQVYAFAMHMQALAMVANGSVTVLSHPSLAGIASGSGISGSTAWHGAFRFRQYLKSPKVGEGEQPDTDLRELEFKKNQYGPTGETIVLRYQRGLFLPEHGASSLDKVARESAAAEAFLQQLKRLIEQGQDLGPNRTGLNYGPTVIVSHVKGFRKAELEAAMQRLLDSNKIHIHTEGPPSKRRKYLRPGPATNGEQPS
jgi:RecA-family ATPase